MPGVSIHVIDVSRGVVAAGMEAELHAVDAGGRRELVAKGRVGANGLLNEPQLSKTFAAGGYVAGFHVADFYRAQGVALRCRSSMSSASTSAFPTRRSTITCRSNARRGAIRVSGAAPKSAGFPRPEQFLPHVQVLVWDFASAIWSPPDASPPRRFVAVSWLGDGPSPRCWFAATSRSRERAPRLVGSFQTIAVVL